MKKTLVLASLLAAFGAASAQSSVTLYGVIDTSLGQAKNTTTVAGVNTASTGNTFAQSVVTSATGNGVNQTQLRSGDINGSRWGVRGSEALGNGMNAKFQLESGFGIDNGASQQQARLFGRQAFVGVDGGFGSLTFGRQYTSYDSARAAQDTTGHTSFSTSGLWNTFGRDYTFRADNSIRFDSANYSGFSVSSTMGLGEDKTTAAKASSLSAFHVKYAAGPILALVAIQAEKYSGSAPGNLGQGNATTAAAGNLAFGNTATGTKETHTLIAGSYNFGVAKLNVGMNTSKDDGVGAVKDKEMHVGVNVPFGPAALNLTYGTSKQASKYSAKGVGAEVIYNLSPRTFTYVGMTSLKGDDTPAAGTKAVTVKAMAVGLRHAF